MEHEAHRQLFHAGAVRLYVSVRCIGARVSVPHNIENSLKLNAEDIAEVEPMVSKVMEIYVDTELSLADRQPAIESALRPWVTELESFYYVCDE